MASTGPDKPRFVIVPHRPHARLLLGAGLLLWVVSVAGAWMLASRMAAPATCGDAKEVPSACRKSLVPQLE